ncbi:hypothetical protein ACJJWD_09360 [Comamonas testosteroni]|uniref:hypothetical protein n=1 Tax=Comamonas testosteroni TaxID=285 RepID=UPI00389AB014
MKETGLMFKAPLVRAILSGQKTQTRRIVNWRDLQPGLNLGFSGLKVFSNTPNTFTLESQSRNGWESRSGPTRCPMGQPGDRIYVRETFAQHPQFADLAYRAEGEEFEDSDGALWVPKWTPAIHMPRKLARIWLEITGVRVERLQSISRGDAMAEGCPVPNMADGEDPRDWFAEVWKSTGGDWAANPWVWVIDFKRIEKPR